MMFQVFVIFYVSILSYVYTQEANPWLNIQSQEFYEPVAKQNPEDKSQKIVPEDSLHYLHYNKDPIDKSFVHELISRGSVTKKATKTSNTNFKSECQYWCVTPGNKFYCCDDDSNEELEDNLGVCPMIRRACHVSDVNLAVHFSRKDDKHVPFQEMAKKESCIIDPEILRHLRLYHQRYHNMNNGNISVVEIFGSQHRELAISPKLFGLEEKKEKLGVFKEDLHDKLYERPFFRALKLALNIGTLTKAVPHIPLITLDPGREHYSDKYAIYDSYLPEDMLTSNEYKSMLSEDDVLTNNKDEPLLLSRITRHIYNKP